MRLHDSVDAWHDCAVRVIAMLRRLPDDAWTKPTDCPRWTVHDVAAHLAAIETELAGGGTGERVDSPDRQTVPDAYTQRGVDERADVRPGLLTDELETAVQARYEQLRDLEVDPSGTPDRVPGGLDWSWERLLSNRVIDFWVHEQDIREAVGVPGGMESPAAAHTVATFRSALPYVLGKKVASAPGTSVRWTVTGSNGFEAGARVGDTGRAEPIEPADAVTATLSLDEHAFTRRMAGRRSADDVDVTVGGDADLARRVLAAMTVVG